jgi:hypothetical protein
LIQLGEDGEHAVHRLRLERRKPPLEPLYLLVVDGVERHVREQRLEVVAVDALPRVDGGWLLLVRLRVALHEPRPELRERRHARVLLLLAASSLRDQQFVSLILCDSETRGG